MRKADVRTFQLTRATIVDCAMEEVRGGGFDSRRSLSGEFAWGGAPGEPSPLRAEGC